MMHGVVTGKRRNVPLMSDECCCSSFHLRHGGCLIYSLAPCTPSLGLVSKLQLVNQSGALFYSKLIHFVSVDPCVHHQRDFGAHVVDLNFIPHRMMQRFPAVKMSKKLCLAPNKSNLFKHTTCSICMQMRVTVIGKAVDSNDQAAPRGAGIITNSREIFFSPFRTSSISIESQMIDSSLNQ
jgi:hypothetical protein